VQKVTRSYHEEQHADYLKNSNFLHDSPIHQNFKNISHTDIFSKNHDWLVYSI